MLKHLSLEVDAAAVKDMGEKFVVAREDAVQDADLEPGLQLIKQLRLNDDLGVRDILLAEEISDQVATIEFVHLPLLRKASCCLLEHHQPIVNGVLLLQLLVFISFGYHFQD